jgi:hypothetical protein
LIGRIVDLDLHSLSSQDGTRIMEVMRDRKTKDVNDGGEKTCSRLAPRFMEHSGRRAH